MKTLLAILIFVLASTATAQKKLPKKPYTEWSLQEAMTLLQNSPWVEASVQFAQSRTRYSPDLPPGTEFDVGLRLYSALPIRQAIVRQMQLTIPYVKLTAAQQASFDAEVDGLLKCPQCAEYYIVTITSTSQYRFAFATRGDPHIVDTVEIVKGLPQDELLRRIYLSNDQGERRNASRVLFTPRHEMLFLFRRFDEHGSTLITSANKKFFIEFDDYLSKKTEGSLKKFTFNVGDITRDTEVLF